MTRRTAAERSLAEIAFLNYTNGRNITDVFSTKCCAGKRAFIVGGGASLRGFDWDRIKDEVTIGVNKSFLYVNTMILYLMDLNLYQQIQKDDVMLKLWNAFSGIKVMAAPQIMHETAPGAYLVNRYTGEGLPQNLRDGIICGNNSGFGALMLATILGCNPIYLLGFDLKCEQYSHWHEGYHGQSITQQASKMSSFMLPFFATAPLLGQAGVRVVNLNLDSALSCFQKQHIDEVLV